MKLIDPRQYFPVQGLGRAAYSNDRGTNKLVRQLLCLPLLPQEVIVTSFEQLSEKANETPWKSFSGIQLFASVNVILFLKSPNFGELQYVCVKIIQVQFINI